MSARERPDPLGSFRYKVEIDGLQVAGFSEISGLQVEIDTEDYSEGGVNEYVHKLPKGAKYQNITLKHGMTDNTELLKWQKKITQGTIDRKNINIYLQDALTQTKQHWLVQNAYPVKWTGPDLKADANNIAIETLELVHEGIGTVE